MLKGVTNYFKRLKIKSKVIFIFTMTVLIPLLVIGDVILSMSENKVIEQTTQITMESAGQTFNNISNTLLRYTDICNSICYNNTLLYNLSLDEKYQDSISRVNASNEISKIVLNDIINKNFQLSIKIFFSNDTFLEDYLNLFKINKNIEETSIYKSTVDAKGGIVWNNNNQNIVLSKEIKDSNNISLGVFQLEIPESEIFNLIKEYNYKDKLIILCDEMGKVVTSNNRELIGSSIKDNSYFKFIHKQDNKIYDYKSGSNFKVMVNTLQNISIMPNWYMLTFIPMDDIISDGRKLKNTGLLICSISLLISCFIFIMLLDRITEGINILVNKMKEVGKGELQTTIEEDNYMDEIGSMMKVFNIMTRNLDQLVLENYEAKIQVKVITIKNREAELYALQSQIHPHFLFNTLESIRMKLQNSNIIDASEMIVDLSKILRKSLNWNGDIINLCDEIDLVNSYLRIQKYRFRDKVDYKIEVGDDLFHYKIPKFSIQPLVENSIKHGIENKWGNGLVQISANILDNILFIKVVDNGIGMDIYTLNSIKENISNNSSIEKGANIGIKNIHDRIVLYYGNEYGIEINSEINRGTEIILKLPIVL